MFAHQFNRRPFFVDHRLVGHPLFELPRLVALAQALPPDEVEYNAGDVPVNADYRQTPAHRPGRAPRPSGASSTADPGWC